jgi:hypothetical protein
MESVVGRAGNDNGVKTLGASVEVKAGALGEADVVGGSFLVGIGVGFEGALVASDVGTADGALGWLVVCGGRVAARGTCVGDRVWGRRVVFAATGANGIGDAISTDGGREAGSFTLGSPTPLESTVGDSVVASDAAGTTVRPRTFVGAAAGIGTANGNVDGTRCGGSCADSAAAVWLPPCRDPLL